MTTSNNPRERRSHILLVFEFLASSTETRLWTWLVWCAASEGHDTHSIAEVGEYDTQSILRR